MCEYRKENGKWLISRLKFTRTLASDPSLLNEKELLEAAHPIKKLPQP
jgi:hypothetical protein